MASKNNAELLAQMEQMQAQLAILESRNAELQAQVDQVPAEALLPPAEVDGSRTFWSHFGNHILNLPKIGKTLYFKPFFPGHGNRWVKVIDGNGNGQAVEMQYLKPGTEVFRGSYVTSDPDEIAELEDCMKQSIAGAINPRYNNALRRAPAK